MGIINKTFLTLVVVLVPAVIAAVWFYLSNKKTGAHSPEDKLGSLLKSSQQQSEILLGAVTDGVIVADTTGKISLFNPAATVLTGWDPKDATGIDVRSVLKLTREDGHHLAETEEPFKFALEQKKAVSSTLELTSRDNVKRIVSLVISPVVVQPDNSFVGVVAVIRDVSKQRKEEMQRAEFISTASHEMRTPVSAIEGYLALAMNDNVSNIDSKARDYLEKAHSSTQHLGKLFQDLLTSTRAEDGRLNNHPVVVEMCKFLDQLTQDLKFSAEKKGLLVDFIIGSTDEAIDTRDSNSKVVHPLYYVHVDPDRIREVVTDLFDNAVKYTETGKITVGLTGNNEVVQFYIKDTGPGIPKEDIPHLFQKFYRVNSTLTRTVGGTGLGLFICRKIIELYQGKIWVESEIEKGSTFYINLPRLQNEKAAQLQAKEAVPQLSQVVPTTKV